MTIYHIIYKTTHLNGRYYIGRHTTRNKNDKYLGSGKWIKSIKNKSELSKEILAEASSIEELYKLEERYITKHYDDPLCMNYKRSSTGWNSLDVSDMNRKIQENGKSRSQNRAKNLYDTGRSGIKKWIEEGNNPFFKREDGTSVASDRVKNGNHNLVGGVTCVDKDGNIHQIKRDVYHSQKGDMTYWEYVSTASNEGRKRTGKKDIILVSCVNKEGKTKRISKEQYYSQSGRMEDWGWVSTPSNEAKRRKNQA